MKRLVMKLCVGLTVLLALLRSPAADPMSKDRLLALQAAARDLAVTLEARPHAASKRTADRLADLDRRLAALQPASPSAKRKLTLSRPKSSGGIASPGTLDPEVQERRTEETHLPTPLGLDRIGVARALVADLKRAVVDGRDSADLLRGWKQLTDVIDEMVALQD
jgi:hypothetical protein